MTRITQEVVLRLLAAAKEGRNQSYSPYSNFAVGAALLCKDGSIITGCNVENASYGLTNCAERTAIFKAVSEGHREFLAMVVVADTEGPCSPCGACRQVMSEFNIPHVIMGNLGDHYEIMTIDELLPYRFK